MFGKFSDLFGKYFVRDVASSSGDGDSCKYLGLKKGLAGKLGVDWRKIKVSELGKGVGALGYGVDSIENPHCVKGVSSKGREYVANVGGKDYLLLTNKGGTRVLGSYEFERLERSGRSSVEDLD